MEWAAITLARLCQRVECGAGEETARARQVDHACFCRSRLQFVFCSRIADVHNLSMPIPSVASPGLCYCCMRVCVTSLLQLGDGTTTRRDSPPSADVLTGVTSIAAGGYSTCVLMASGGVRCWGDNGNGQVRMCQALSMQHGVPANAFHSYCCIQYLCFAEVMLSLAYSAAG